MERTLGGDALRALETMRSVYADREAPAREAKSKGQKIVGCVSNNVPMELVLAAGMFPFQITGDPTESTDLGDRYMESFHDGNVRSLFDRILRGHFNYVDLIIIPRSSESYLQLYYYLLEARRWEPERTFPDLYLLDLLQTPFYITGRYDRGRMDALRTRLETLAGSPISDDALSLAIDLTNETRAALAELNEVRRRSAVTISGADMLRAIGASEFMERRAHIDLVRTILDGVPADAAGSGPRVMIKGSPQDTSDFYELVEGCGAHVVADDHVWGERLFEHPIEKHRDLMESLTLKYQRFSPSPRSYPQAEQDEIFLGLVEKAQAEGVIFYLEENDDTFGWDYPVQKRMLDDRGKASLYLKFQPYRSADSGAQVAAVTEFLRQLAGPRLSPEESGIAI